MRRSPENEEVAVIRSNEVWKWSWETKQEEGKKNNNNNNSAENKK